MLTLMMMLRAMDDVRKGIDVMTTTVVTMMVETSGEVMRWRRKMLSGWRAWQVIFCFSFTSKSTGLS